MTTPTTRRGLELYRPQDAYRFSGSAVAGPAVLPEALGPADLEALKGGGEVRVLFRHDGPEGFSLLHACFGPGFVQLRHSHDVDCLYHVLRGEVTMGSQVVSAGSGFFVAAHQPYGYRVGEEGVEMLEFRNATSFGVTVLEADPDRLAAAVAAALSAAGAP